jgi:ornithine cyclodeaminase
MWVQGSDGLISMMPAQVGGQLGYKAVTVFPSNNGKGVPTHQAIIGILDGETGTTLAFVDGTSITEIRTAAVSAVATQELARKDATTALIVGAGAQGRSHVLALATGLSLERILVWNRDQSRAEQLVAEMSTEVSASLSVAESLEEAAPTSEIVVTTTSSSKPVLSREWIRPGTHINAVGACIPSARELDTETMRDATVVVDLMESALAEAGELVIPISAGDLDAGAIKAELGQILTGEKIGRSDGDEITVFKSLGLGVQDVAAAHAISVAATANDVGQLIDV